MSLASKHIVITRASHQAGEFAKLLEACGAHPLLYPCIEIVPPQDTALLDNLLYKLDTFDWLLLTSSNTVYALHHRLSTLQLSLPSALRIAAVGSTTARETYETFGLRAETLPEEFTADALAEKLTSGLYPGTRFFLPQSEIARPDLANKLTAAGGEVTTVSAYRTITATDGVDLPVLLKNQQVDALTFTSPSTVEHFLQRIGIEAMSLLTSVCTACIGSVTAETACKHGFRDIIVPQEFTLAGMISVLEDYFSGK